MRTYDHGSSFVVTYDALDAEQFAAKWPGSTVQGGGSFEFANSGTLIDTEGSANECNRHTLYDDWLAFSKHCHAYGQRRIPILRQRKRWAETKEETTSNRKDGAR